MTPDFLRTKLECLTSAIRSARQPGEDIPALMLLYATIDVMAWLDRPEAIDDVRKTDFLSWVETYLLPGSRLSCTAIDLYGARCALLHSYSAESRLSREGAAREIHYVVGGRVSPEQLPWLGGPPNAVVVHTEDLVDALEAAIARYLSLLSQDPRHRAFRRADRFFTLHPVFLA